MKSQVLQTEAFALAQKGGKPLNVSLLPHLVFILRPTTYLPRWHDMLSLLLDEWVHSVHAMCLMVAQSAVVTDIPMALCRFWCYRDSSFSVLLWQLYIYVIPLGLHVCVYGLTIFVCLLYHSISLHLPFKDHFKDNTREVAASFIIELNRRPLFQFCCYLHIFQSRKPALYPRGSPACGWVGSASIWQLMSL